MKKSRILGLAAGFLTLIILLSSAFTVDETEQVIVFQFGKSK